MRAHMHTEAVVAFALGFLLTSLLQAFLVYLNSVYFKQLCRMLMLTEDLQIHCISNFCCLLISFAAERELLMHSQIPYLLWTSLSRASRIALKYELRFYSALRSHLKLSDLAYKSICDTEDFGNLEDGHQ